MAFMVADEGKLRIDFIEEKKSLEKIAYCTVYFVRLLGMI